MKATNWDLMKLAQVFEGEFNLADFSEEEIGEMLGLIDENMSIEEIRERYYQFHDDVKDRTLSKHKWSD